MLLSFDGEMDCKLINRGDVPPVGSQQKNIGV
jgi:hypothetical protein